jgi:hypothetical protein
VSRGRFRRWSCGLTLFAGLRRNRHHPLPPSTLLHLLRLSPLNNNNNLHLYNKSPLPNPSPTPPPPNPNPNPNQKNLPPPSLRSGTSPPPSRLLPPRQNRHGLRQRSPQPPSRSPKRPSPHRHRRRHRNCLPPLLPLLPLPLNALPQLCPRRSSSSKRRPRLLLRRHECRRPSPRRPSRTRAKAPRSDTARSSRPARPSSCPASLAHTSAASRRSACSSVV